MKRIVPALAAVSIAGLGAFVPNAVASAAPGCEPTSCSQTFGYSGGIQTFVVPQGVTSINAEVFGAEGGEGTSGNQGTFLNLGGESKATVPVTPGEQLKLVVGQDPGYSSYGAGATFGGGGSSGGSDATPGGGGSFLFGSGGQLLLAAGGGGGVAGSGEQDGGAGGSARHPATGGQTFEEEGGDTVAAGPGTMTAGGAGGYGPSSVGGDGTSGDGPSFLSALAAGGAGGYGDPLGGGGGGGGFYAGGGGSADSSGGGGSGYAFSGATAVGGQAGVQHYNGSITLTWNAQTPNLAMSVAPGGPAYVGERINITVTISGSVGSAPGTVGFTTDEKTIPSCSSLNLVPSGRNSSTATCSTTSLGSGKQTLQANFGGDGAYGSAVSSPLSYQVDPQLQFTPENLPSATAGSPYQGQLRSSGGTGGQTWRTARGSALPPGLTLSRYGEISGSPTRAGTYPLLVEVSDSAGEVAVGRITIAVAPGAWAGPAGAGRPSVHSNGTSGFYLGSSSNSWRVEITQPESSNGSVYTGSLQIDSGQSASVVGINLGGEDQLRHNQRGITFRIGDNGQLKGFDFTTPGVADSLRLSLLLNGRAVPTRMIYLGPGTHSHPFSDPFNLQRIGI